MVLHSPPPPGTWNIQRQDSDGAWRPARFPDGHSEDRVSQTPPFPLWQLEPSLLAFLAGKTTWVLGVFLPQRECLALPKYIPFQARFVPEKCPTPVIAAATLTGHSLCPFSSRDPLGDGLGAHSERGPKERSLPQTDPQIWNLSLTVQCPLEVPRRGSEAPLVHHRDAPESAFFVLDPSVTEGSAMHSWSPRSKWLFHARHCQLL